MIQSFKDFCERENIQKTVLATIFVAALGYMVDVFDLVLFGVVRVQSLKALGLEGDELLSTGIFLINTQMAGLLVGGFLWGVWGDRVGRVSVLFGSILLYSVANIANAFVQDVDTYAILRFVAGIGLAGELGAGVTLASELFPRKYRGLCATFIATIGVSGAVLAALVGEFLDWRTAYMIGGCLGLVLLVLRMNVQESGMFEKVKKARGLKTFESLRLIFFSPRRLYRYLAVVLVGAPIWGIVGLFFIFSPEFGKAFGMVDVPTAGRALLFGYIGLMLGDAASGLVSQFLQSRKKAILIYLGLTAFSVALFMLFAQSSLLAYYLVCGFMGFATGYWAMFIQVGAEQFGTNIRATAATSIPNLVRACTIPTTIAFQAFTPAIGLANAGAIVALGTVVLALLALSTLKETFDLDLDYVED